MNTNILAFPVKERSTPVPVSIPDAIRNTDGGCPRCKGAGWLRQNVPLGHPQFGKLIACQCHEQKKLAKTYTWLGLDEDGMGDKTFEAFTRREERWQQRAYDQAMVYSSMLIAQPTEQSNLFLFGKVGTGKTHLACAVLNRARANGIECLFSTVPELFTALYAADFEEKERMINQASITPILCLDDIDKLHIKASTDPDMPSASYQKGVLFDIFNRRYRARRPTLVTTNAQSGLDRWLDEATQDRLLGHALQIQMIGESQRGKR